MCISLHVKTGSQGQIVNRYQAPRLCRYPRLLSDPVSCPSLTLCVYRVKCVWCDQMPIPDHVIELCQAPRRVSLMGQYSVLWQGTGGAVYRNVLEITSLDTWPADKGWEQSILFDPTTWSDPATQQVPANPLPPSGNDPPLQKKEKWSRCWIEIPLLLKSLNTMG